jgi:hypothetical protein
MTPVVKLLVLTSEPITADQLRGALPGEADPRSSEVMVVSPALQESALRFWLSDADQAIARAQEVTRKTVDQLGSAGFPVSGDTGESDPIDAIQDALQSFSADRIVLFTHGGEGRRYREDIDASEIQERFGLPVDQAQLSG